MKVPLQTKPKRSSSTPPTFTLARSSLLQRKCACGGTPGPAGECESCRKKKLQRRSANLDLSSISHPLSSVSEVPPILHEVEPRFGHDFGEVSLHANERVAGSQHSLPVGSTAMPVTTAAAIAAPQRQEEKNSNLSQGFVRTTENRTGLPDKLLTSLERLSGHDLSDVLVHYNSIKPAQIEALAYTEGKNVFLGAGQERHLPHEGWHVVQQIQGRVSPTGQMGGMPISDDTALEHEADLMGAKARAVAEQSGARSFRARIALKGDPDDEPYTAAVKPAAPTMESRFIEPDLSACRSPIIQRFAFFREGKVQATTNLASHMIAGQSTTGSTPPTLNGKVIMKDPAVTQAALKPPVLAGESKNDGTVSVWVDSVPTNVASFTMQLPSPGPWSTETTKKEVARLFNLYGLTKQEACSGPDSTIFTVKGRPTDAVIAADTRTHENLHAADHRAGFTDIIAAWDASLMLAKWSRKKFSGASMADAESALYEAMGGTPDEVATWQTTTWLGMNERTHEGKKTLATGGKSFPCNSAADPTCAKSSLDLAVSQ